MERWAKCVNELFNCSKIIKDEKGIDGLGMITKDENLAVKDLWMSKEAPKSKFKLGKYELTTTKGGSISLSQFKMEP